MQGIKTKVHGPNAQGNYRVSAQGTEEKAPRIYTPYRPEWSDDANHAFAALSYSVKYRWRRAQFASTTTDNGDGRIFTRTEPAVEMGV